MFLDDLARRLRERRELRRLTQADVASTIQVSPQAVSKWERGENAPDITALIPLADLLGVSTDWILGGHERRDHALEATVFVSSILSFTSRCERMEPADVAIWANGFFHQATEAVLAHGGVPVKYIGDGFLAFFAGLEHQARAVRAAVSARAAISDQVVVALATGPVHLAGIGHAAYARPDILGTTVNRAFRANGWAMANAASRIVLAAESLDGLAGEIPAVGAGDVTLKGVGPVRLWEVGGPAHH